MKTLKLFCFVSLIFLLVSACGENSALLGAGVEPEPLDITWQDYYDLGIRYLSEDNYQEAIIAFTAAIEIDMRKPEAYVGRADAYIGVAELERNSEGKWGDTAREHYLLAIGDYTEAIRLGMSETDVFLKTAKGYVILEDYESALSILEIGIQATGSAELRSLMDEIKKTYRRPWGSDINTFSAEQQVFVKRLAETVMQGDIEASYSMLRNVQESLSFSARIEYGEYKIEIGLGSGSGGHIEIRPHQGEGYYCHYEFRESEEHNLSERYGTGNCSEWNWNGEFSYVEHYFLEGACDYTERVSGTMENSLLSGVMTIDSNYTYIETGKISERTYTKEYKEGVDMDDPHPSQDVVYSAWVGYAGSESLDMYNWNGYYDEHNRYGHGVKFCVSEFRQSQGWR